MRKRITLALIAILTLSTIFSPLGMAQEDTRSKVLSIANNYIGVPYKYGGTTTSGFDCSGFTSYVFNQVGIKLPRTSGQQYNQGTAVSKANLEAGDLVFFNTSGAGISHVGIYIGSNKFISATTSKGVKVDSINDKYYWGSRYVGAKRVLKEEEQVEEVVALAVEAPREIEVPLAPGEFRDVSKSYWAYEQIYKLSNDGIITGYKNDQFKPEQAITRAEAAKMLTSTLAMTASSTTEVSFGDVPEGHWAYEFIAAATENQLVNGYKGNIFKPDEPITRGEVATLIARAFELEQHGATAFFNDLPETYWAYDNVQALATNEIVHGYNNQTFKGENETTRAEFAAMLYSALNLKYAK